MRLEISVPRSSPPRKHEGETISEYFNADRAEQVVRRYELLAILTQYEKARRDTVWWKRAWHGITNYYRKSAMAPVVSDE